MKASETKLERFTEIFATARTCKLARKVAQTFAALWKNEYFCHSILKTTKGSDKRSTSFEFVRK